jgi:outer membrane biogenesis lipoprotein LolB
MSKMNRALLILSLSVVAVLCGCSKEETHKNAASQVHDAAWYAEHPDDLRRDEKKCAGDAATMSRAACQNIYSAENAIEEKNMRDAATRNGAAGIAPAGK